MTIIAQTTYSAAELSGIILLTLQVTLCAIFFAILFGMPLGIALALGRFTGRRIVVAIVGITFVSQSAGSSLEEDVYLWMELENMYLRAKQCSLLKNGLPCTRQPL